MSELVIYNHIIDEPIINIVRQLKEECGKPKEFRQKQNSVRVTCPSHKNGEESDPSCSIYSGDSATIEYGLCHCFTCGFSGPLWHFVAECFGKSDEFGKQWLIDRFSNTLVKKPLELSPIELNNRFCVECLDDSFLSTLQSFHPYMTKRKLNQRVCEQFRIKYEPRTQCIVFPVYDEYNNLVMCTRRSVNNKTFIIDANKEKPVYLYNFVKEKRIQEITIVESQINALTLWGWSYPACALFGTGSKHQYDILNKSDIRHYYLAFDGDSAGDKGIRRFLSNIRKDVFVDVIEMPRGKDVNDLTVEEFDSLKIVDSATWLNTH